MTDSPAPMSTPEGEPMSEPSDQMDPVADLIATARRVVNTVPSGQHVAVDLFAYNDLRDVLRALGALDD